ncbi:SpdD protein [Streptomyces tibetensis]|uniref:SpdD protein n=1 Tax=Streptomyces tibetensis TaxID=2382123 RepID=UPI003408B160
MFRPKLPDTPHVPSITTHIPQDRAPAPFAGRSVAPFVGVGAGAVAAVVVVLTALLAAVAVSAVSVAIAAVVLRSLVTGANRR